MRVTVVFPKPSCYEGKNTDTQRIYNANIKKYLSMLSDNGCSVEYLLEDKLARDFIRQSEFQDVKVLTCVSKSDIEFFSKYRDLVDLQPYVYTEYNSIECIAGDVDKKYTVPITLVKEDRNAYLVKRVEVFRKRIRVATDKYLSKRKAVLMFRTDNGLDRATALRETIEQGDGRLCIEVNLNSNMAVIYYGGVFIQEEHLPMILSI